MYSSYQFVEAVKFLAITTIRDGTPSIDRGRYWFLHAFERRHKVRVLCNRFYRPPNLLEAIKGLHSVGFGDNCGEHIGFVGIWTSKNCWQVEASFTAQGVIFVQSASIDPFIAETINKCAAPKS